MQVEEETIMQVEQEEEEGGLSLVRVYFSSLPFQNQELVDLVKKVSGDSSTGNRKELYELYVKPSEATLKDISMLLAATTTAEVEWKSKLSLSALHLKKSKNPAPQSELGTVQMDSIDSSLPLLFDLKYSAGDILLVSSASNSQDGQPATRKRDLRSSIKRFAPY